MPCAKSRGACLQGEMTDELGDLRQQLVELRLEEKAERKGKRQTQVLQSIREAINDIRADIRALGKPDIIDAFAGQCLVNCDMSIICTEQGRFVSSLLILDSVLMSYPAFMCYNRHPIFLMNMV